MRKIDIVIYVVLLIFLLGIVCGDWEVGKVYAEITEEMSTTTENITESSTEENTTESTTERIEEETTTEEATTEEASTEDITTEEIPQEPVDETPPEVKIVCMDEDGKAKESVLCHITISDEDFENCKNIVHVEKKDFHNRIEYMMIEDIEFENEVEKEMEFSEEGYYRIYIQSVDGMGNETISETIEFLIDRTAPDIMVNMGKMKEKGYYETKKEKREVIIEVEDYNLVKEFCKVAVIHNMQTERIMSCEWEDLSMGRKTTLVFDDTFEDGNYKIIVYAKDEVGNEVGKEVDFSIDNTAAEIEMDSDMNYEKWTSQDVVFQTKVEDNVSGLKEVIYKVKGEVVKRVSFEEKTDCYYQEIIATKEADKESGYSVSVEVINGAGIRQSMKRQVYIDKTKPEVSLSGIEDGQHYAKNQVVLTNVMDISYKETQTEYYVTHTKNGKSKKILLNAFLSDKYEDSCIREFTQEGKYEIYAMTTDSAGNCSKSNTLSFVIDKTAPVLEVKGVEEGAMTPDTVILQISCREAFYATNKVEMEIVKTLDGKKTTERVDGLLKEGEESLIEKQFSEDGTYCVSVFAKDKAGNEAKTKSVTFSVDKTKPEIQIIGTDNYQLWSKPASLRFSIEESNYEGNQVSITGTRKDIDGKIEKLNVPAMKNDGKISSMLQVFEKDGIYELQINAKDLAGNANSKEMHFVIDQTSPEINGVEKYDGGYYSSFQLADSMEGIFKDLTVVSYQMYLNGVEYNGTDKITREDKYNLLVQAQDELGHENRKSIEFIVDCTPPKVRFLGVMDGERVEKAGTILLTLDDAEDDITGIRVNDVEYDVALREIPYTEYGNYRIEVDCKDKAGNRATESISFTYANVETQTSTWKGEIWMSLCVGLVGVLGICAWVHIRTKQKRREE
ncbi:MAG: hypothetical protein IJD40_12690 [Lachnospiraceae bacterium]|nr:hypothetical protein [Lachnospiraceae bacterium]